MTRFPSSSGNGENDTVACPICEGYFDDYWGLEYKSHVIVKCTKCGLRYVSPRRNEIENLAIYDSGYFQEQRDSEENGDAFPFMLTQAHSYIQRVLSFCDVEDPRILDIGTGTGLSLRLFKMMGYHDVAGTDLYDVNKEHLAASGIKLFVGDVRDIELDSYDVVTCYHVLEHVMDPNPFLARICAVLNPGGILHVVVPNEGSLSSIIKSTLSRLKIKSKAYKHLSPGHHLYFYVPNTLEMIVEKHGFHVLYRGTCSGSGSLDTRAA